jgi:hypothetical protein
MDMVDITSKGRVIEIQVKPKRTHLEWTWILAVWGNDFSNYLHETTRKFSKESENKIKGEEIHMGHVIK